MSDPAAPAAAAPEPAAGGAAPAPAPAPAAEAPAAAAAPVVAEAAPAAGAAPAAEAPKEGAEAPKLHTDEPSLVEGATADGKPKAEEAPKPGEEPKPGEQPKPAEQAPAVEFKPYTFPEGFKNDDARVKSFNEVLAKADLSPQDRGQALVDMHIKAMTDYRDEMIRDQHKTFGDMRREWRDAIKSDPEIGGSGYETTLKAIATARDMFVPKEKIAAFNQFLRTTGAGDNPEFARFLVAINNRFKEPSPPPPSFKPPSDIGVRPRTRAGQRDAMYDHPNSQAKRS